MFTLTLLLPSHMQSILFQSIFILTWEIQVIKESTEKRRILENIADPLVIGKVVSTLVFNTINN